MERFSSLILSLILTFGQQGGPTVPGRTGAVGSGGGGGTAPTIVSSCSGGAFSFSSPFSITLCSVSVNDIVVFEASSLSNGATETVTVTGTCVGATTVIDAGPVNQGVVAETAIMGHIVITTGGSCSAQLAYTGTGNGNLSVLVVRGSSGLDVASAINNQGGTGAGANAITTASSISLSHNDLCVAGTVDGNYDGGTLTAGTTLAWTLLASDPTAPNGIEYFTQNGGTLVATFGISNTAYSQTAVSCYKP
jgi:hypothetical protein